MATSPDSIHHLLTEVLGQAFDTIVETLDAESKSADEWVEALRTAAFLMPALASAELTTKLRHLHREESKVLANSPLAADIHDLDI